MARYNLNTPEEQIATSFLFELDGYLDNTRSTVDGRTARQALADDPNLDITVWIRTTPTSDPNGQDQECALWWWIRVNDNVNVAANQLPPETPLWIPLLEKWRESIDQAFVRVGQVARDGNTVPITAEDGTITQRPAGLQLVQQRSIFEKVLAVLQQ